MSIEAIIKANTAAIEALTAALLKHPVQVQLPLGAGQYSDVKSDGGLDPRDRPETEKPAAGKSKTTAPASSAPEPVAEVTETAAPAEELAASEVTLDEVKAVTIALGNAGKRDSLVKLLQQFGAAKATALEEQHWAAYVAAAKQLLEA